ncbi:MAG: hypothetical protein NTX87_20400 [Planctomycetota bacterium]|nr:hypothetical protein [Planctomycetota bacterium]
MRLIAFSALLLAFACCAAPAAEQGKPAPAEGKSDELLARITSAYMGGNWEDLDAALAAAAKPAEMKALSKAQKADIDYVRQAMAECRPAWWNSLKAGKKASFQVAVWGRAADVVCDPDAKKSTIQVPGGSAKPKLTLGSDLSTIDNPDHAEHGYTKGDLAGVGFWQSLGSVVGLAALPQRSIQGLLTDKDKLRLGIYLDFRGDLTTLYYGTPTVRQWGLWLYLAAYMEKYSKMEIVNSRKAAAAVLLAEVLKSPATYPFFALPDSLPDEGAEGKLALHFLSKLNRKKPWTLAGDNAFRAAVKAFALVNEQKAFDTGKVVLPGNQAIALMAADDAALQAQRDKFVKAAFDKIKAGGK